MAIITNIIRKSETRLAFLRRVVDLRHEPRIPLCIIPVRYNQTDSLSAQNKNLKFKTLNHKIYATGM